jgi:hypothetical protein
VCPRGDTRLTYTINIALTGGVLYSCLRCPMIGADRIIRESPHDALRRSDSGRRVVGVHLSLALVIVVGCVPWIGGLAWPGLGRGKLAAAFR